MAQNLSRIYKCANGIEYVFFSGVKGYRTPRQIIFGKENGVMKTAKCEEE